MVRTLTHWTVEDYHRMIESGLLAGRQVELINGQIVDRAPELPIHRVTYRRGAKYLEGLLGDRAVVFATAAMTLRSGEPQPDICIAAPPNLARISGIQGQRISTGRQLCRSDWPPIERASSGCGCRHP